MENTYIQLNSNNNLMINSALIFKKPKKCSYWNRFLPTPWTLTFATDPISAKFQSLVLTTWLTILSFIGFIHLRTSQKLRLKVKFYIQSCFTFLFVHPPLICKRRLKCLLAIGISGWLYEKQNGRMDVKCFQQCPGSSIN